MNDGPGLPATEKCELLVLETIRDSQVPLGCGTLAKVLHRAGWSVAEATVGRLLRDLEARDLLSKVGRRGRVLQESGQDRLHELMVRRQQVASGHVIQEMLRRATQNELVDVLIARRAVEGETAALAAQRASDAMLENIRHAVEDGHEHASPQAYSSGDDVRFHTAVADAAGNGVLKAALDTMRHVECWSLPSFISGGAPAAV